MAHVISSSGLRQAGALRDWALAPGGLYNIGNALGLASGLTLAVLPVTTLGIYNGNAILSAMRQYLMGDPAAVALSIAMVIFFYSGIQYDRAWKNGAPPITSLNRSGDMWSGFGALFLGLGLLALGQPILAATAGLLHAIGKFGSAWTMRPLPIWKGPDFWRTLVLISRFPAIAAAILAIIETLRVGYADVAVGVAPLAILLTCYLLWVLADLKLFRS